MPDKPKEEDKALSQSPTPSIPRSHSASAAHATSSTTGTMTSASTPASHVSDDGQYGTWYFIDAVTNQAYEMVGKNKALLKQLTVPRGKNARKELAEDLQSAARVAMDDLDSANQSMDRLVTLMGTRELFLTVPQKEKAHTRDGSGGKPDVPGTGVSASEAKSVEAERFDNVRTIIDLTGSDDDDDNNNDNHQNVVVKAEPSCDVRTIIDLTGSDDGQAGQDDAVVKAEPTGDVRTIIDLTGSDDGEAGKDDTAIKAEPSGNVKTVIDLTGADDGQEVNYYAVVKAGPDSDAGTTINPTDSNGGNDHRRGAFVKTGHTNNLTLIHRTDANDRVVPVVTGQVNENSILIGLTPVQGSNVGSAVQGAAGMSDAVLVRRGERGEIVHEVDDAGQAVAGGRGITQIGVKVRFGSPSVPF